jgi:hypothetical protein
MKVENNMTRQIRKSVFETNSSSTHSIYISNKECVLDRLPVDDGVCRIYSGEFGWEFRDYYGAASKASYCMTYIFQMAQYYDTEEKIYKYNMEFSKHLLDMLTEVIMENTKAKSVEYVKEEDNYYPYGYIDHQSSGVCGRAFENKEALKNFIFNPKSYLHTSNDNEY